MKRNIVKTFFLVILLFSISGDAMAQLRMKRMIQSGSPLKFMKAHPEYIYLNKPEEDNVTGFTYYISETLNPRGAGLNNNNYYILIESFDHNEKPKALIWDGVLKQKLVKKMTTSTKRVIYFNNTFILDQKNLLTFLGFDEKFKFAIKCGLSSNGSSYAKNWWQKHTISGNFTAFANIDVKTEWTQNPSQWLKDKLAEDKTHRNICIQDPASLTGTYGWFFDIKNNLSKENDEKFNCFYEPKLYLWKDEDHSIPLNFCKVVGTELSYYPDMNRDEARYDNVVKLSESLKPDIHQYYFLDWSALADVKEAEKLPEGKVRLKAYYTVDLNAKTGKHRKGHVLISMGENGVLTLDIDRSDPRQLCPPHKYEVVGNADTYTINNSVLSSKTQSSLPSTVALPLCEKQLELLRQDAYDGSVYYISREPANSDLWEFAMKGDNKYELFDDYYNDNKSYSRVMEFIEKLNEKVKSRNMPYTFMLPTFEELKKYASNNDEFKSYYPSFVDSICIYSKDGDPLTLGQYMEWNDKASVYFFGGTLKDKEKLGGFLLNDSTNRVQFYLKAIPDSQQKEVRKSSVTRFGLLRKLVKRCSKCGKEIYSYKRSKAQTVQEMIESVGDVEDFNAIKFAYELFLTNDYDKAIEIATKNGFVEQGKKSKTFYWAIREKGDKVVLGVSRLNKKYTTLYKIDVNVNKWTDESIVDCLKELGFSKSNENTRSLAGNPVVTRIYVNPTGKEKVEFETFHGSNVVKIINFEWASE